METIKIKCKNHENQNAFKYCYECNIYMCHKCLNAHLNLFQNHHLLELSEDISQIFNGFCKEENHSNKLEYFCETHNQLCCLSCIGKNNNIETARHKYCKLSNLIDIKNNKKISLEKNFIILKDLSKNINDLILKEKNIFEKINDNKEELKLKIQKIMTNLRNKINEREDELFSILDSQFLNYCPSENMMKDFEKLPKKIKNILEKKEEIDKKLNDTFFLNSYINDCINIENNTKIIQEMINSINQYNKNSEIKLYFFPEEKDINKIYNAIKSFWIITKNEEEKKNFCLYEEKEIIEKNEKIKGLEEQIKNIQKNIDNIKNELNKEKDENKNLRNKLQNTKIKFTIRSRCALNKCLDTKSLSYGNSPHLWDYGHNNQNQIFELIKNYDGNYCIKNSASGLYLGFDSNNIVFRNKNENSQSFKLIHFDDGYYIFQEKGGAVIDLYSSNTQNGAYIGKFGKNNGHNQQWKLVIHL